jgi:hypothetical protein
MQENPILISLGNNFIAVQVEDALGCVDQDTFFYQVNPSPFPQLQLIGSTNFCIGETAEMLTNTIYTSYLWSSGATTPSIEISEEAWVWLYATNQFGCSAFSDSMFVSATELTPHIIMNASPPHCPNQPLSFTTDTPFDSYLWDSGVTSSVLIFSPAPGEQFVAVEVANLCGGTGVDTFYFDVLPATNFEIVYALPDDLCVGTSINFSVIGEVTNIQWQNASFGMNYTAQADEVGAWQISVEALDSNFCPVFDTTILFVQNCYLGIEKHIYDIQCFPNPTNDYLYFIGAPEKSFVLLYDALGQLILNSFVLDNKIQISEISSGIYFIEFYSSSGALLHKQKVIKQ